MNAPIRIRHLRLAWTPLDLGTLASARLAAAFARWWNTPYAPGVCSPSRGVDCIRFGAAVLDEMDGVPRESPHRLPPDTAMLSPPMARAAMRTLIRRYEGTPVVGRDVQPGDILITDHGEGTGPGHMILVGTRENTLWESSGTARRRAGRVRMVGWSLPDTMRLVRVYRVANHLRMRWTDER